MKSFLLAGALAVTTAIPAAAELIKVPTEKSVTQALDALEVALGNAGATVFARVDHAAGASKVDMALDDAQVLIFGNPKLGTPAMQADPRAGLYLPLKALAYKDADGQVWISYEDPADMFAGLDIAADAPFVAKMQGALGKLTAAAAN